VITLLAIVATANHYWIDAGIAFVLVAIAAAVVLRPTLRRSPAQGESWPGLAPTDRRLRPLFPRHSRRPGAVLLARSDTSSQLSRLKAG